MPWEIGRFTHRELQDLEEKLMIEAAEAEAEKRRLGR